MVPSFEDATTFLAVVETRSFTAAAERLARTKSAVSQAVSRLEADLGLTLLHRSTRALSLTEEGARFYARCRDIRDQFDTLLSEVQTAGGMPSGTLTLTAPHALCDAVVTPALARLAEDNPALAVRLFADDARVDIIEAQIDLAIRVGMPDQQTAKVSKLGTMSESLYASAAYVAARGGVSQEPADLAEWDHIANDWQGVPVKYDLPGGAVIRIRPRFRCNAVRDILRLAEMGAGVARLPDYTAAGAAREGRLVKLAPVARVPVYAVHMFSKRAPEKVRLAVRLIRDMLRAGGAQPA